MCVQCHMLVWCLPDSCLEWSNNSSYSKIIQLIMNTKNLLHESQVSIEWVHGNCDTTDVKHKGLVCSYADSRLCTHGWLWLWSADMVSDCPAGTRPGWKMDGDDGVLVVSCFFLLLLLLCKRDTEDTCLNTAPACWHTGTDTNSW